MNDADCCLSLGHGLMGYKKLGIGTGKGRARKSVCYVGVNVGVFVGMSSIIIMELTFYTRNPVLKPSSWPPEHMLVPSQS